MPNASDRTRSTTGGADAPVADTDTDTDTVGGPVPVSRPRAHTRYWPILVVIGLLAAYPLVVSNSYFRYVGVLTVMYMVLSSSWNLMGGFTGYISLGHVAFFGVGAYTTGLIVTEWGVPNIPAVLLAGVLVGVIGAGIGYVALRVRGSSFVIVTIALVYISGLLVQGWRGLTGGSSGLSVPTGFDGPRSQLHQLYHWHFVVLLLVVLSLWWFIDRSKFGMGLKAVREDEDKAQSLGVPTANFKLVAFVLSAAFTGMGGGLYASWFSFLDPIFTFQILIGTQIVLMALLGGIRSLWGPVLGAAILIPSTEYFLVRFGETQLHLVATGVLLALVVLLMPDGIIPRPPAPARSAPRSGRVDPRTAARDARRGRVRLGPHGGAAMTGHADSGATTFFRTTGLSRAFGGVQAVDGADVELLEGRINGLIGPNGSGKTTFFNCVTGMIPADSGEVVFKDRRIDRLQPHKIAQRGLGRTFQVVRSFPRMTVIENMLVAVRRRGIRELLTSAVEGSEVERAEHWLRRVGIDHLRDARAADLSYGQQKLLELAAVLMAEPELILLDEPAGGVNPVMIDKIAALVRSINAEGTTFLVVEHNMEMVMSLCDHVVVFDRGRPIAAGPPSDVQRDERVLEAYLGV